MSSIFSGGPESESKRPGYTRPGGDFLGEGKWPGGAQGYADLNGLGGYFGDVGLANMFPYQSLYGGLQQSFPQVQQGGQFFSGLGVHGTANGYGNLGNLAYQAAGQGNQIGNLLGLQMPAFGVANQWAQGISPAIQGTNMSGGSGAGQQVMNAALAAPAQFETDIFQRAIADSLPQVRASYSARGLGTGGEAARGEQDFTQRLADQFAQQAVQARLGALNVAASGANTAANEAAAFGNIGLGRGNLAQQAAMLPGGVINQFLQGQQLGLQGLGMAGQQQFQPLQLAGLGAGVWGQGMQFPLDYTNTLYGASRQPFNWLANFINGVPNIGSSGQSEGFLGIG